MSVAIERRLERLANEAGLTPERLLAEEFTRYYCNLWSGKVSTEGLELAVIAMAGGFDLPDWVSDEFDRDIPADAVPALVEDARLAARESLKRAAGGECQRGLASDLAQAADDCLGVMSRFAARPFSGIEDIRCWCDGPGREYQPINFMSKAPSREER